MFIFKTSKVDNHTITSLSFLKNGKRSDIISSLSIKEPDILVEILNSILADNLSKSELDSVIEGIKFIKNSKE